MGAAPAEHYARSREGLWVRARRQPAGGGLVEAQARIRWVGRTWQRLDADGAVTAEGDPSTLRYGAAWDSLGTIPLPFRQLQACVPLPWCDWLIHGALRHAAELVAGGWGATAAEAVGWFAPLLDGAWVVTEARYAIVGPFAPGLPLEFAGAHLVAPTWMGAALEATLTTGPGPTYPIALAGLAGLAAFAVGAVPVL